MAARRYAVLAPAGAARARLPRAAGRCSRNPLAVVGAAIVLVLIVMALFAPWIATHSATGQNLSMRLMPPSAENWMGTDELGRDIWSRVVFGSRITLVIVLLVAVLAAPGRPGHRRGRRLFRRLARQTADGHHRHLPVDAQADPGAGLRGGTRARHPERHHRHRDRHLAWLCAHRARRDADHPQFRISSLRSSCRAPRRCASSSGISCRSAPPR